MSTKAAEWAMDGYRLHELAVISQRIRSRPQNRETISPSLSNDSLSDKRRTVPAVSQLHRIMGESPHAPIEPSIPSKFADPASWPRQASSPRNKAPWRPAGVLKHRRMPQADAECITDLSLQLKRSLRTWHSSGPSSGGQFVAKTLERKNIAAGPVAAAMREPTTQHTAASSQSRLAQSLMTSRFRVASRDFGIQSAHRPRRARSSERRADRTLALHRHRSASPPRSRPNKPLSTRDCVKILRAVDRSQVLLGDKQSASPGTSRSSTSPSRRAVRTSHLTPVTAAAAAWQSSLRSSSPVSNSPRSPHASTPLSPDLSRAVALSLGWQSPAEWREAVLRYYGPLRGADPEPSLSPSAVVRLVSSLAVRSRPISPVDDSSDEHVLNARRDMSGSGDKRVAVNPHEEHTIEPQDHRAWRNGNQGTRHERSGSLALSDVSGDLISDFALSPTPRTPGEPHADGRSTGTTRFNETFSFHNVPDRDDSPSRSWSPADPITPQPVDTRPNPRSSRAKPAPETLSSLPPRSPPTSVPSSHMPRALGSSALPARGMGLRDQHLTHAVSASTPDRSLRR